LSSEESDRRGDSSETPPSALVARDPRASLAWLALIAAVLLAIGLVWSSWRERGTPIEIEFPEGHGLAVGDAVRHRGISVGTVREVVLASDGSRVVVHAEIDRPVAALAGEGTRFWIVRPRVDLAGVGGLDTIVGPRYVEMRPEGASSARRFVGLDQPPAVESIEPGDRRFLIDASARGSLARGAGVYYRQVRVGTVLSVGLADDSNSVQAEILVEARYAPLVQARTRFFPVGTFEFGLSLEGLRTRIDSLETLLLGGVAFATPPGGGREAPDGLRFAMDPKAEDEWLEWRPSVPLSALPDPAGIEVVPLRLTWNSGGLFSRNRVRTGWAVPTDRGLLAPRSLLEAPAGEEAALSVGREQVAVDLSTAIEVDRALERAGLAVRPAPMEFSDHSTGIRHASMRAAREVENAAIYAGESRPIVPLSASRLRSDGAHWRIDPTVPIAEELLGAAVVASKDGALVGLVVLTDNGEAMVGLLSEDLVRRGD
jgi:paraquat-inducible protein B